MEELKVGIMGAGFMGKTHASSLAKIDGVKISAICSFDKDLGDALAQEINLEGTVYTSFDDMLATETLDAIYFCIPPFAHQGEVIKAANKGIHVFLEKPIALNSADATQIVDAVEKSGVVSQVGYQMRFRQSIQKLYSMIADGSAGKPTLFQGRYWCNMGEGSSWWAKKDMSGGQILEQVVHLYDLALSLFGEVDTACGVVRNLTHTDNPAYEIEDTSAGLVSFKNGAVATITGSNCAVPVHFFGDFKICFEHVTLDYKSTGQHWVNPDTATLYYGEDRSEEFVEDTDVYLLASQDFIQAIRTGSTTQSTARDGLKGVQVIEDVVANSK